MSHGKLKKLSHQFGGKVTDDLKRRYSTSPQWKSGKFENLEETKMEFHFSDLPDMLYKQFLATAGRIPKSPIPIHPFDRESFMAPSEEPKFIWYGHSVLLIRWKNKTILIDPMLGPNASPIAPFATSRFSEKSLDVIDGFPEIDLLLMTHDHYDHLDYDSIIKLLPKTKKWFVALGVGRHLESWGVKSEDIQEFDWWDSATFENIDFVFTPSRHFSGRGVNDRAKSLWGGWSMKTDDYKIYWSGDGGYGDHFKDIGQKLGPFDIGFMECGQYNEKWHQIHMYPEESVQAAIDVGVAKAVTVHWAGFPLAMHTWKDPIKRFYNESAKKGLELLMPKIGEIFNQNHESEKWWIDHL